jgi:tetratricopeptide (TPR) repeat protein
MPVPAAPRPLPDLVRDGRAAVQDALSRSAAAEAWEALLERDQDGNAKGALAYTDTAIRLFEAAHQKDPDDIGVVHHLAIARHARAWDLELLGDPRAAQEWEEALARWRQVAAAPAFWDALRAKLHAVDPSCDAALLAAVRRDLLFDLLEVHVDFVRHYCEAGTPERAASHVEIVRRARIPPAAKKKLVDRVYDAMTAGVPEARASSEHESALTTLERFLELFPDHLPALRQHAEVSGEWVRGTSYERWDEIRALSARAEPHARRLAQHPQLAEDPLARVALQDLCAELALKGRDRGTAFAPKSEDEPLPPHRRDAGRAGFEFGLDWARLGSPGSPRESRVRVLFGICAQGLTFSLHHEALENLGASDLDQRLRFRTARRLYERAQALLEEARRVEPEEAEHDNALRVVQNVIDQIERLGLR